MAILIPEKSEYPWYKMVFVHDKTIKNVQIHVIQLTNHEHRLPFEEFLPLFLAGLDIFAPSFAGALLVSSLTFFGDVISGAQLLARAVLASSADDSSADCFFLSSVRHTPLNSLRSAFSRHYIVYKRNY